MAAVQVLLSLRPSEPIDPLFQGKWVEELLPKPALGVDTTLPGLNALIEAQDDATQSNDESNGTGLSDEDFSDLSSNGDEEMM